MAGTALYARHLTCEHRVDPIGMDEPRPRFSWRIEGEGRDRRQSAYRIRVASDRAALAGNIGLAWDSGEIASEETLLIAYDGAPLRPRTRYYWTVAVRDEVGRWSEPSEPACLETGTLGTPWAAQWIKAPGLGPEGAQPPRNTDYDNELCMLPVLYLRKAFRIEKPVASARLYATALGVYQARINGERVSDEELAPGWTDYRKRVAYQVADVGALLRSGDNVLGCLLGEGWYSGYIGFNRSRRRGVYGDEPELLAELHVTYADGSREIVAATGPDWRTSRGPVIYSDLLMGEKYNALLAQPGWDRPGFDDSSWHQAWAGAGTAGVLEAQREQPIRVLMDVPAKSVLRAPDGTWVFDLGQNIVGRVRIEVRAKRGQTLSLRHAEMLAPDGTLYLANLRTARATDIYVAAGAGEEVYEPAFTFHGFRYVGVSGLEEEPAPEMITGRVIANDLPGTARFETSSPLLDQLHSNIVWGQRGNFLAVPTDCPQRDERLGWTADAQVFARTAGYHADVAAFFIKWLIDLEDAQSDEGAYPDVAPRASMTRDGAPAWGDAGIIVPWLIYERYGDRRVLERHYAGMVRWMDFIKRHNPDYRRVNRLHNNYGDWLSINADTPKALVSSAYYGLIAKLMAQIAGALGIAEDEAKYQRLHQKIAEAFCADYVDADGRVSAETQTAYLLALHADLLPRALRAKAAEHLVENIRARNMHLSTGFLGVRHLCPVLTEAGHAKLAYRLALNETYPSWGYSIRNGATTIWERWDGWTEHAGFQSPNMNSFNHYAYGSIGEWLFEWMAGIGDDGSGAAFKRIVLKPTPGPGVEFCRAVYVSPRGEITSAWERTEDGIHYRFAIPANTTARVILPAGEGASVTLDGREVGSRFEVGSGSYEARVREKERARAAE